MPTLPDSGFDYVAAVYDPLARLVYGQALRQAQQAALDAGLPPNKPRVLIIGGGTGWVIGQVLGRRPGATVLYLEASPRMLARSRQWFQEHLPQYLGQVEFRLGTEAALQSGEQFEAIITFFFLDLFAPVRLRALVSQLKTALAVHGTWLVADFGTPSSWWQHGLLTAMYSFFGLTAGISAKQRPPIEAELARLGLQPTPAGTFFQGMVAATVWR